MPRALARAYGAPQALMEIGSARALPPSAQSNVPTGGPDRGARAAGLWRCLEAAAFDMLG